MSFFGNIQNSAGQYPEQPDRFDPDLIKALDQITWYKKDKVLSNLD